MGSGGPSLQGELFDRVFAPVASPGEAPTSEFEPRCPQSAELARHRVNGVGEFEWATLRVPGVLQRIAVSYLVAAVVSLTTGWRPQALTASCGDLYFLSSLVAR